MTSKRGEGVGRSVRGVRLASVCVRVLFVVTAMLGLLLMRGVTAVLGLLLKHGVTGWRGHGQWEPALQSPSR